MVGIPGKNIGLCQTSVKIGWGCTLQVLGKGKLFLFKIYRVVQK